MASDAAAPAPAPKKTAVDLVGGIYCTICHNTFHNKKTYDVHYYEHGIGRDQVVYTCVVCRKDIAGYPSFRGHCYTIHVIKDRFKCEICNKSFSKLTALNDHISTIHKFQCSFCKREFPSKKDLRLHKIMHIMTDTPSLQCMTCNEKVNCVEACEPHIDKHSVSVYTCPICNQKENEKTEAVDHLRLHFDEDLKDDSDEEPDFEPFDKPEDSSIDLIGGIICDTCKKIFKNRAELEQHYNIQHPNRMVLYTCIVCKSKYEKYSKFGNHCYEHISKNRFKCEQCPRAFSRLPRLVAHEATAHGPHPSPRQTDSPSPSAQRCQRCGLTLRARAAAARHLDVHRKKVFACPVCARPYAEKHLVMKHVSQHFEAVFHACKICGNLYNARNRLVEHAKSHADLKTYTCNYCEKGFTTQYKLRQHQNLHTGQRPHSCHACPKSFADYSNLCKHLQKVHKLDPRATRRSRDAAIKLSSKKQWSDDGEWAAPALLPGDGLRDAWLLAAAPPPAPAPAAHVESWSCGEAEMPREYGPDCAPEEALPAVDPRLAAPAFTHIARDITILY